MLIQSYRFLGCGMGSMLISPCAVDDRRRQGDVEKCGRHCSSEKANAHFAMCLSIMHDPMAT
jgi:hypothetical protein